MKIVRVHAAPGRSAFYFDDQTAIKAGALQDGFTYCGETVTPGFETVRQSGESLSVLLELENGFIAEGDCAAVQYSGAAGRDPLFSVQRYLPFFEAEVAPFLVGLDVSEFRGNAKKLDAALVDGEPLHTAIRYGVSQALLDATAKATGRLPTTVICEEYGLPTPIEALPLFGQSGDDRYEAVDKMVLKQVDALPHALINNIPEKLGRQGEILDAYVGWLSDRVIALRQSEDYQPAIHIDVYGTIGLLFGNDPESIADYLVQLERQASPFALYIEGPADAGSKSAQIDLLKAICAALEERDSSVRVVADEWCNTYEDVVEFVDAKCCHMVQIKTPDLGSIHNTIEAVLYAKKAGVGAYQGGTCNETDVSARACVNIALATRPERVLVKPGMGFDEGMTIVANEMSRSLTLLHASSVAGTTRAAE